MSTKKKISDIDKAIEEMQQRRDECFKHIGKAMYESCPELGDMSVADMRKAGHYLHKMLTKKAPSQGAAPVRNGAPVASDSGSTSAPDGREPMPVAGVPGSYGLAAPCRRGMVVGMGAKLGFRRGQ